MTAGYTFDKKTYIKDYRERVQKSFSAFGDLFKAFYGDSFENYYSEETIEKELDEALEKAAKTAVKSMIRRQAKQRQPFSKGRLVAWDIR